MQSRHLVSECRKMADNLKRTVDDRTDEDDQDDDSFGPMPNEAPKKKKKGISVFSHLTFTCRNLPKPIILYVSDNKGSAEFAIIVK